MANIDSLQINISMANKGVIANINDIISALGKLEDKLAVSTSAKDYRSNLNGLAAGFISIGEAINGIDAEKLTTLTKSIGSLSKTMGSVTNIGKSFSNVGVSAANLKEIERLRNEIDKLTEGIEISQEVLDGYREKMAKLNLEIPKEAYREWGDDAKHNRGVIGIRNTHTGSRDTQAVREAFGWEDTFNDTDVYTKLYETLSSLETEIQNDTYKIQSLESEIERLNQAPVDNIVNNAQQISTVGENAGKSLTDFANGLSSLNEIDLSEGQFVGLKTVGKAVKDIASSDLSNVKTQIPQLVEGLNSLQGFVVPNTEGLQATATAIRAFGSKTATRAAEGLPFTVQAISQLSNIQIPNAEGLMSLAQAIGRFGSANAVKASEIMPKLTTELMNMISQLSSAPKVSDNVVRLAEAISQFRGQANASIKSGRNFGNSLNFMGKSARSARIHFTSLAAVFGSLYANFFLLIRGARLAGKAIDYSSQMTEAMNVVDVAFGKMNGKLKDFLTTSIKDFGLGRLAAAQYASRFQAMGKTLGITAEDVGKANDFILKKTEGNSRAYKDLGDSVADMSVNLTKLTADIASLYNQDYDSVAQDMQAVYTGMTRPLRKYGLDLTMATLKEWALKNGLDADVESMTQAEKTLLRYQYVMSNASVAMGDFAKTADTWANAMRTTKQLLQEFARILGEAFINAFRPALLAFRNFMYNMLDLTQSALNAVGKLLGWTKIDFGGAALAEDMEDYADALDDAAGNAKKLKGQLRGIDELNNLTTNDKGGGGGSGDSGIGYNGADLWENIKETQEKYLSDVTDWRDLGRRIANHLQEGLESIDWHEVYANAMGLGKNAAEFLNGLIKPEAFYDFGKTLAGGIMTAIKTAFSFGSNFDWKNLGNSIAEGINGFFDEFDGGELADTLDVWVQGIFKTMKTAASRVDWKEVFKDMLDFLSHIDLETIEIAAGAITFLVGANVVRTALTSAIVGALGSTPLALPAIAVTLAGGLVIANNINEIAALLRGDEEEY